MSGKDISVVRQWPKAWHNKLPEPSADPDLREIQKPSAFRAPTAAPEALGGLEWIEAQGQLEM